MHCAHFYCACNRKSNADKPLQRIFECNLRSAFHYKRRYSAPMDWRFTTGRYFYLELRRLRRRKSFGARPAYGKLEHNGNKNNYFVFDQPWRSGLHFARYFGDGYGQSYAKFESFSKR
jgi:hypothetical protein